VAGLPAFYRAGLRAVSFIHRFYGGLADFKPFSLRFGILKFFTSKDDTREIKIKTGLLGIKNGCKIPVIKKSTGKIYVNPLLLGKEMSTNHYLLY